MSVVLLLYLSRVLYYSIVMMSSLETMWPLKGCPNPAGFPLSDCFLLWDFDNYIKHSLFESRDNGRSQSKKCDISTDSQNDDKSVNSVVRHVLMYDMVHALIVVRLFHDGRFWVFGEVPRVKKLRMYQSAL